MKRALIALAALAAAAVAAVAIAQPVAQPAAETTILPGYWSYKAKTLGITVDDKKRCLSEAEVDDFLAKPCNRHHTCVYPVKQVGNGKIRLEGYWQNKEGKRANVKASGSYTPKHFTMEAKGTAIGGIPIGATIDANWLSATCPK